MNSEFLLIAGRECTERLRSKAFLYSNAFILAVIAAALVLPLVLGDGSPDVVGVVDDTTEEIARAAEPQQGLVGAELEIRRVDADAARELVAEGELDAALIDRTTYLADELADPTESALQLGAQTWALERSLDDAGLSELEQRQLLAGGGLSREAATPEAAEDEPEGAGPAVAFIAVFTLYGLVALYGQWVAQGIVEEKQSRVVEVLLSTVSARQLLAGKIVGLGSLGLLQVLILAGLGVGGATAVGTVDIPEGTPGTIASVVAWFVLGYALYATAFAVAGSLVSRVEDLQSAATPVFVLIIGAFFAAQYALIEPGSTVSQVLGYVPITSPLVQPIRSAAGLTGPLEVAVAVTIALLMIAVLIPLAARIYEGAVLQTRGKVSLRQVLSVDRGD